MVKISTPNSFQNTGKMFLFIDEIYFYIQIFYRSVLYKTENITQCPEGPTYKYLRQEIGLKTIRWKTWFVDLCVCSIFYLQYNFIGVNIFIHKYVYNYTVKKSVKMLNFF